MPPTPIVAAAYLLLINSGQAAMPQPPLIDCPAPVAAQGSQQNHITVKWVGNRQYYDRHHHRRHRHHHGRRDPGLIY